MNKQEATIYLKGIKDFHGLDKDSEEAIDMAIEALQDDWISITEAEPNTPDHVLVTYKWGNDDYEVSELDYWITKYEAENGNAQCKRLIDHVIAWRYMLAPYKGGDTDGERSGKNIKILRRKKSNRKNQRRTGRADRST